MLLSLLLGLTLAAPAMAKERPGRFDWSELKGYAGKSTNELIREKRFKDFLRGLLPKTPVPVSDSKRHPSEPLVEYAIEVLHGPPDPITVSQDRYYVLRACRAHSCDEKGLLILDAKEKRAIAVMTLYFPDGKWSRVPDILVAASAGVKDEKGADALLGLASPFIGSWIDDNKLKVGAFLIRTDSGTMVPRSNNAVDSSANTPRHAG